MLKENKFLVLREKGRSGRISTYLVEDNVTGERAYLKTFSGEEGIIFGYITEMNCLKDAGAQGILTHLEAGIMEEECGYYMLFNEVGGPTLEDFLEMGAPLSESEALRIAEEARKALECLHENECLHLFLCARNVFYSPGKPLMIKDPALTAEVYELLMDDLESPDYSGLSPWLMDGEEPSERDDLYALGALMKKIGVKAEWKNEEMREAFFMEADVLMKGRGDPSKWVEGSTSPEMGEGAEASFCGVGENSEGKRCLFLGCDADGGFDGYSVGETDCRAARQRVPGSEGIQISALPPDERTYGMNRRWEAEERESSAESLFGLIKEDQGEERLIHERQDEDGDEDDRDYGERSKAFEVENHEDPPLGIAGMERSWKAAPLRHLALRLATSGKTPESAGRSGTGRNRRKIAVGAAVIVMAIAAFAAVAAGSAGSAGIKGGGEVSDDLKLRQIGEKKHDDLGLRGSATLLDLHELMAEERDGEKAGNDLAEFSAPAEDPGSAVTQAATFENGKATSPQGEAKTANQSPKAFFTASPSQGMAPLQVCLDASASTDPDGRIISYAWSCGGDGPRIFHVFESQVIPARISITLTVTDDRGASSSTTRTITLY